MLNGALSFEAQDAITQWGDVNQWNHLIGTGPFIIQDFVAGSSVTFVKNPNYWGHDEAISAESASPT